MKAVKIFLAVSLLMLINAPNSIANDDCLECHSEKKPVKSVSGKEISIYVDEEALENSVHEKEDCLDCHFDAEANEDEDEDLDAEVDISKPTHPQKLKPVNCGGCHRESKLEFNSGIHGQVLKRGNKHAPTCGECHGDHNILRPKDPASSAHRTMSPYKCGKCHREGFPIERKYDVTEENVAEHFSQAIHGEDFFKKGLLVSAACVDCHGGHMVLPSTSPKSSISPRNIAKTCEKCHARIEAIHEKVIRADWWESKPDAIPTCETCHPPHKSRKVAVMATVMNQTCLECHEKEDVHKLVNGQKVSLTVDKKEINDSVHGKIPCAGCHSDIDSPMERPHEKRPHETAGRVECANCHAKFGKEFYAGGHGKAFKEKHADAPYCTTCHGDHNVKFHLDKTSPTYRSSIPKLCGECHRKEGKAAKVEGLTEYNVLVDYSTSVHGRGLTEKGTLSSAVCTDCHNSHKILKHTETASSVHRNNLAATCGGCHEGMYNKYIQSVHYSLDPSIMEKLPTCEDCHSAHKISEVDNDKFKKEVTQQCGSCHKKLAETYRQTIHGKSHQLGYMKSAKCSDCHGAHLILKSDDPDSTIGSKNIVNTCRKCHEGANLRFAGYLTHATHQYQEKYPALYYTYWFMTILLVSVFGFFGIHTLLWLPRSIKHIREERKKKKVYETDRFVRRFNLPERITHLFVILSFLTLALTGMMLKFSDQAWAGILAGFFGGVAVAGAIHRIAAVVTFGYFMYHFYYIANAKRNSGKGWLAFIFGKNSLMFNLNDIKEFAQTMKWFMGLGERPKYGRWTYWEKFDYFAVFWGVPVIGISGLVLWFPEFTTQFLPGWSINLATIIHSDEALLAVGFIFTIHFFNTHLRPESFPLDPVIFTGIVPADKYKEDRPREYEELLASGELKKRIQTEKFPESLERIVYFFGFLFLGVGVILVLLMIFSALFA